MRLPVIALVLSFALCAPAIHVDVRADAPARGAVQTNASDRPHRSWKRVRSNNFVAVGDASESALRDALTELEVFRSAMFSLTSVLPAPRFSTSRPLMVIFRDDSAFGIYKPRNVNGGRRNDVTAYYSRAAWGAHMVTAADGDRLRYQLFTALRQYARDIFRNTLGNPLPMWLDEGLADLCGSVGMALENRVTGRYLGRPIDAHVMNVRSAAWPRVAEVLEIDGKLAAMKPVDIGLVQSKSWALVHYLLLGRVGGRPGDVPAFVSGLAAGQPPVEAFQRAFRVNMAEIDADLAAYVSRLTFPAIRIEDTTADFRTMTTEPMLESEVSQLQGQLLMQIGDLPEAEKRLMDALARNPASVATRVSLATFRSNEGRPRDAIELMTPAVTAAPADAVALITLGRAQQQAGNYRGALESYTAAGALKLTETSAPEVWYGRSLAAVSLGLIEEGATSMDLAQSLVRSSGWFYRRARDLWAAGLDAQAVADVQAAVEMPSTSTTNRSYASFVGALAAKRMNQPEVASGLLTRSASPGDAPWTRTAREYLLGTLTDRQFLDRAGGRGEETEAHAYIGLIASLGGRTDEARQHLVWVRDRGAREYTEFEMAIAELARLEGR